MSKWIKTTDKLPENGKFVFLCFDNQYVNAGKLMVMPRENLWRTGMYNRKDAPTHWREIDYPPKKEWVT